MQRFKKEKLNLTLTIRAPTHALLKKNDKNDQNAQRNEITDIFESWTLAH
jgi:hypothetical protein